MGIGGIKLNFNVCYCEIKIVVYKYFFERENELFFFRMYRNIENRLLFFVKIGIYLIGVK